MSTAFKMLRTIYKPELTNNRITVAEDEIRMKYNGEIPGDIMYFAARVLEAEYDGTPTMRAKVSRVNSGYVIQPRLGSTKKEKMPPIRLDRDGVRVNREVAA